MAKKRLPMSMTAELRKLMNAQPFAPFDVRTTDGDTVHVFHPDYIMISPSQDMAILCEKADAGHSVVNLRHVVSMQPTRPKKGLLGQGGGKR